MSRFQRNAMMSVNQLVVLLLLGCLAACSYAAGNSPVGHQAKGDGLTSTPNGAEATVDTAGLQRKHAALVTAVKRLEARKNGVQKSKAEIIAGARRAATITYESPWCDEYYNYSNYGYVDCFVVRVEVIDEYGDLQYQSRGQSIYDSVYITGSPNYDFNPVGACIGNICMAFNDIYAFIESELLFTLPNPVDTQNVLDHLTTSIGVQVMSQARQIANGLVMLCPRSAETYVVYYPRAFEDCRTQVSTALGAALLSIAPSAPTVACGYQTTRFQSTYLELEACR